MEWLWPTMRGKWNKTLSQVMRARKPPEQWGQNEYFNPVIIPLHNVCPQRHYSRNPQFCLRRLINTAWQSCHKLEGKENTPFSLLSFIKETNTRALYIFPFFLILPLCPDVWYSLGSTSPTLEYSWKKGPLPVMPTIFKALVRQQCGCHMLIN